MQLFRRKKTQPNSRQRRNAPTTSPHVFSYASRRPQANRLDEQHIDLSQSRKSASQNRPVASRRALHMVPTYIAAIVIVFSLAYSLTLTTNPRFISASSRSSQTGLRSEADYQAASAQVFSRSWLYRFKLTFDARGLERQLQDEFPEFSDVAITVPLLGRRPVVVVQYAQPKILFTSTAGASYVLDQTGRAMIEASKFTSDTADLLPVADQTGYPIELGKQALSTDNVDFILAYTKLLTDSPQKLIVKEVRLPAQANQADFYLVGKDLRAKYFRTSMQEDAATQAGTTLATYEYITETRPTVAEYIDVRVPGRAYYK